MSESIFLVGKEYFDVYTIEAGRGATGRADFLGGTGIVNHLFRDSKAVCWVKDPTANGDSDYGKFGRRISLGITDKGDKDTDKGDKDKVIFADNVSAVFGNDKRSQSPPTQLSDAKVEGTDLRVGFYSLPGLTEGDIDRASHGRRFPGLGSLFHARLIECLADTNPQDSSFDPFDRIFEAAKHALKEGETYRKACLTGFADGNVSEAALAGKLRELHRGGSRDKLPFIITEQLKLPLAPAGVLYICDYGDLTEDMCIHANNLVNEERLNYVLYRASTLGPGGPAYECFVKAQPQRSAKRVIVTKADHLRGLGTRLNPFDWFNAMEDLISSLREAWHLPPDSFPLDGAAAGRLRQFLDDADILVIRFGLEGFALAQKIDDADRSTVHDKANSHSVIVSGREERRPDMQRIK